MPDQPPHVIPVEDPAGLGSDCAALLHAASLVLGQMLPALGATQRAAIEATLQRGGALCIEASVDDMSAPRVVMTCVAPSGARLELASAFVSDRPRT